MAEIGRFQVMAMLQAARAVALGLPLPSAKSWGLNRAIFYAAARRGFKNGRGRSASGGGTGGTSGARHRSAPGPEWYTLGGERAYQAPGTSGKKLRFMIGGKPQTPEDFDRQIKARMVDWDKAWKEARQIIADTDTWNLMNPSRFHKNVYEPVKLELIEKWSRTSLRVIEGGKSATKRAA